jgi:hypothetical protein
MAWAGHVAHIEDMRNAYRILSEKLKVISGRSRCAKESNMKTDLKEIGWEFVNWIHQGQCKDQWRDLV